MATSTILENVSVDELKVLISDSVRTEFSKLTPTAPETNNSIEQPISQPEAIKFLGKSRQTLISWRKKGVITAHLLGGRVYYLKSELIANMK
jgi:Helix-turn-helix domain